MSETDQIIQKLQRELNSKDRSLNLANKNKKLTEESLTKANKEIQELKDQLEKAVSDKL